MTLIAESMLKGKCDKNEEECYIHVLCINVHIAYV